MAGWITLLYPVGSLAHKPLYDSYWRQWIPGSNPPRKYARGVHGGQDIPGPSGTRMYACYDGKIWYPSWGSAYGKHFVIIDKAGRGYLYAHCSGILVPDGAQVHAGQYIARMGDTGQTTNSHLHFEYHPIAKDWHSIQNPYEWLEDARRRAA